MNTLLPHVCVILPSLNPDEKLSGVVDGLLRNGFRDIILVNDGSSPEALHYFQEAAVHSEVTVLNHPVNRGKGAALKTAFSWVLSHRSECLGVVTADGDGQHHPDDILACCLHMLETGHITLGCRDFSMPEVPVRSRFGNRMTSFIFRFFIGMKLSDTQTGLRAIPRSYLETMLNIVGDRYEYETQMLLAIKHQSLPYDEVSIRTVYLEENKSSHFRLIRDSWRIYRLILGHFFRYTISSFSCSLVDTGSFALLSHLLSGVLSGFSLTAAATLIARLISSLLNFSLNYQLVFRGKSPVGKAMLRYYMLAVPQMLMQILLTQTVFNLMGVGDTQGLLRTVYYSVVMVSLYIASFFIQQRWVFKNEK